MEELRNEKGESLAEFLAAYRPGHYERPSVTVDMVVFTRVGELLLIKRRNHPNIGKWALPGGFIEMGESLHESALRELVEETGVSDLPLHSLGIFGAPDRDPRTRIITAAFAAEVERAQLLPKIQPGDDAAEARLFSYVCEDLGEIAIPGKSGAYPELSLPCSAAGEPYGDSGRGYRISLSNGEITLSVRVALSSEGVELLLATPDPGREEDGAVAGDHGLIIFSALRKLGKI